MAQQAPEEDPTRAEDHMRSVIDYIIDGVITIDERGKVLSFNPAAERLFGYKATEVIGRNVRMLMPEPYSSEHDSYLANYLSTGVAKIIGSGREVIGRRKDGSTFPMDLAISEFRRGGVRYFTGIVRDITERKRTEEELRQAEERMRSVVNNVIDGIITIDETARIASFNPAAEKLFGFESAEVMGKNVKMLMPEPYHGEHDGYVNSYVHTGQAKIIGIGREVVGRRKDGSTFPMELAVSEFRIGARRFFTGIVRDITERKRLEQDLRQRVEELADADRQKNDFLAMLAHELRNPLAPMRNALHLIKMPGAAPSTVDEARAMMERQLEHLVRLVDDLLDVSRIIRNRIELRKEALDIASVVQRAIETAAPVIDAHGHQIEVSLADKPVMIEADAIRMAQIISNLLTNAAKYSKVPGRIWLTVRAQAGTATISVRDQGIGIEPELLPRIFDLFVQGDHSLARAQGGMGIGLTLVKRLVEMHAGEVHASSPGLGQGSEFTVTIPALPEKAAVEGQTPGDGRLVYQADVGTPKRRRRVLVVDDNVDAAESIAMILRMTGYEASCVYDGPAALVAAKDHPPDVFVLDIGLPGMTGYEVAHKLREQPRFHKTPIVAVTGYGQYDDRQRSRQAGFDYHLTKPVNPDVLQALLTQGV